MLLEMNKVVSTPYQFVNVFVSHRNVSGSAVITLKLTHASPYDSSINSQKVGQYTAQSYSS